MRVSDLHHISAALRWRIDFGASRSSSMLCAAPLPSSSNWMRVAVFLVRWPLTSLAHRHPFGVAAQHFLPAQREQPHGRHAGLSAGQALLTHGGRLSCRGRWRSTMGRPTAPITSVNKIVPVARKTSMSRPGKGWPLFSSMGHGQRAGR